MRDDILKDLNREQQKAVTHESGPLLIIAGAGTGKTSVVTRRIAWLILEKRIKPDEILALTFTEKASAEMSERVDKLLPYGYVDLWISTFHGFAEKILRLHGLDIGLPTNFRILTDTELWYLVRKNLDRFNLDYYRPLGNPTKFIHALLKHFSRAKDEEIGPEEYLKYAEELKLNNDAPDGQTQESRRLEEIANSYHIYQKLLLENSALDFGDLINFTLKLFKTRPNVLALYRRQFHYVLIDEFQDTNWAQYEMVKLLASPGNNITVVGDDDQSIYKFRGASVSNILTFKNDFSNSSDVVLTQNYRSPQNILDLSYKFIQQNNPNRLEARINEKGKKNGLSNISKKLIAQKDKGIIEYLAADTQEREARQIAERIVNLRQKSKVNDQGLQWSDFAILVRANHEADIIMRTLDNAGVPYEFLASRGLFAKPLILNIISYFRLLDNYHESSALYRLLTASIFAIDHNDVSTLLSEAKKKSMSLFEACKILASSPMMGAASRKNISKLLSLIEKHTALARQKSVANVLLEFVNDSGLLSSVLKSDSLESFEAVNLLRQLFKKMEQFESASGGNQSVRSFIESVDLSMEAGDEGSLENTENDGPETVKIMTVHGAKGLEFEYVFIAHLVDKRFPTVERKDPIEFPDALVKEILPEGDIHLEEERRLMYVAMTRAKSGLFLASAKDYGGKQLKKPSRFLIELGFAKDEVKEKKNKIDLAAEQMKLNDKNYRRPTVNRKLVDSLPKRFSFTQLKAFEICPYQYRFAHILKIPVEGKYTFSFGKTMHKTLEIFYRQMREMNAKGQVGLFASDSGEQGKGVKAPTLEDFLRMYDESWIDEWYSSRAHRDEYYEKGKKILKEFYEKNSVSWTVPDSLEKAFHLKVGNYTLKGVIDRIDKNNSGKIEIIDYKTGKPKEESKISPEDKEQLLIYQIASQEILKAEPEILSYYYLDNNTKVSFLGKKEDLEKLKTKIIGTIEAIKQSDFAATPDPMKCKFCDFAKICEFRKLS